MLRARPGRGVLRLMASPGPLAILAAGQLVAWGTLYYGIAFLAPAVVADTGWPAVAVYGAYSAGLLAAALLAPATGRLLVRHGARRVMPVGTVLAAIAFALMAGSQGLVQFLAAWLLAGAAMAATLYEAAFAALREQPGVAFRRAVTVIALVGGFASTLFWPLTQILAEALGWRATAVVYTLLNLGLAWSSRRLPVGLPLPARATAAPPPQPSPDRIVVLLAVAFACAGLATAAVSAHVGVLLAGHGRDPGAVVLAAALIGPMQVAGRLLDWRLAGRVAVRASGRLAFFGLFLGLLSLAWGGDMVWVPFAFAVLYGAANGLLTVVRGSAPAEWLPGADYAAVLGRISAPALAARALAPLAAASILAVWGAGATLWLLAIFALAGLLAFSRAAGHARMAADHCEGLP